MTDRNKIDAGKTQDKNSAADRGSVEKITSTPIMFGQSRGYQTKLAPHMYDKRTK